MQSVPRRPGVAVAPTAARGECALTDGSGLVSVPESCRPASRRARVQERPLPVNIADLRQRHPDHWMKAAALRVLAMDAVQKANSGHPGMPMGMADVATVLFERHLKFDASAPHWPDRDRFVLSAGHGSMLLYGLLYLTGYADMTLDELKHFRQLGSQHRRASGVRPRARGSRPRPGRSARGSPTRSAWRSPRRAWRRASGARSSTTTPG